jgi:hypothetical protein
MEEIGRGNAFGQRRAAAQAAGPDHGLAIGQDLVGVEKQGPQLGVPAGAGNHLAIGGGEIKRAIAARARIGLLEHPARGFGPAQRRDGQAADGQGGGGHQCAFR